ncbi:hypothetical protein AMATHDRAFT_5379 [Amanita thiersii Skay4041]|uniref:Uncharacterized protein n=1 Tax=Amanita thiersii Skay4041 TaxID=703135 RepID=A0A2A9NMF4_9AGAR|nr:hypothetical protein AMATHDRAFT_5379 [Amanita thiersii Skay4041]
MPIQRPPYNGSTRKLVIAFDVGTTFSGVSYAMLEPGMAPQIFGVTKFPGQEQTGGDSKIQSVVLYDQYGRVSADNGLELAEWFKLHLYPQHPGSRRNTEINELPPLPRNKTAIQVYGDLLKYMFESTKSYIRQHQGMQIWRSFENNIHFVLSHPNGWEGKQQAEMRSAAISTGLVTSESEALERVHFVTEGEASLHFCLTKSPTAVKNNFLISSWVLSGYNGMMVVDCGGGTIDISTYTRSGKKFKEIAPPKCLLQGSVFITRRAHKYFYEFLQGSRFDNQKALEKMVSRFNSYTKLRFSKPSGISYIMFGGSNDNDPNYGIKSGSIKLAGEKIANFFDPSINSIIQAIENQINNSAVPVKVIFLVCGFGTSAYLFSKLEAHFAPRDISVIVSDPYLYVNSGEDRTFDANDYHRNKARNTAMDAKSFQCTIDMIPNTGLAGIKFFHRIVGVPSSGSYPAFAYIKGTEVSEKKTFRRSVKNALTRTSQRLALYSYRGSEAEVPEWWDKSPGMQLYNLDPVSCL